MGFVTKASARREETMCPVIALVCARLALFAAAPDEMEESASLASGASRSKSGRISSSRGSPALSRIFCMETIASKVSLILSSDVPRLFDAVTETVISLSPTVSSSLSMPVTGVLPLFFGTPVTLPAVKTVNFSPGRMSSTSMVEPATSAVPSTMNFVFPLPLS